MHRLVKNFIHVFPSHVCPYVQVKFVVSWAKDEATLDKFLLLLQRVFSKIRPFLTLEAVCHSRLEFLCSLPQFKLEEFTVLVHQKEAQLLEEGVVEIFVGDVQLLKVSVLAMVASGILAEICCLYPCLTGIQSRSHTPQATENRFVIPHFKQAFFFLQFLYVYQYYIKKYGSTS